MPDPTLHFSARSCEFAGDNPFLLYEALRGHAGWAFLWKGREDNEVWLGCGGAAMAGDCAESRAILDRISIASPQFLPRAFCAVPFDREHPAGAPWTKFSFPLFIIPHITIRCKKSSAQALTIRSAKSDAGSDETDKLLDSDADGLRNVSMRKPDEPRVKEAIRVTPQTQPGEWHRRVEESLREMATTSLRKIVLSRTATVFGNQPFHIGNILTQLARQDGCSIFAMSMGGDVLLGATPERLFAVNDDVLSTESLAGTRPRGRTEREDKKFAAALMDSEKERREHNIVREFIEARLQSVCSAVEAGTPAVRKLNDVQHLYTPLRATLRRNVGLDDLLAALHPTPAVCGDPREAALEFIRRCESSPRGYYAGAVGWLDKQSAEMAVAIRCALIRGQSATVFAGAGIVPGSDPHAEWEETENKMKPMLRALEMTDLDVNNHSSIKG